MADRAIKLNALLNKWEGQLLNDSSLRLPTGKFGENFIILNYRLKGLTISDILCWPHALSLLKSLDIIIMCMRVCVVFMLNWYVVLHGYLMFGMLGTCECGSTPIYCWPMRNQQTRLEQLKEAKYVCHEI